MYNRLTSFVRETRCRLSGNPARAVDDDQNVLSHPIVTTTTGDDELDGAEIEDGEEDETLARDGQIDYDATDDNEGEDEDDEDDEDNEDDGLFGPGELAEGALGSGHCLASVNGLFGPGELERRLREEAACNDDSMTEIDDSPAYVDALRESDELTRRLAEIDDDERAAFAAEWNKLCRRIEEDRRIAEEAARKDSASDSDSDSGSSSSIGSDWNGMPESLDEPGSGHAAPQDPVRVPLPAETREEAQMRSPTPDFSTLPPTEAESILPSTSVVASLEGAPKTFILTTLLGRNHGSRLRTSKHGPPTPVASRGSSPATNIDIDEQDTNNTPVAPIAIPPAIAAALVNAGGPNRLKRHFNGDAFTADGNGGYISSRTQRHVERPFERTHEENQFLNNLRYFKEMHRAMEERQRESPEPEPPAPSSQSAQPANVESQDVDMADHIPAAIDYAGDCSPSPDEGTSSQHPQPVQEPATPRSTPHGLKRARSEDDGDAETQLEKRRRVETEEQTGSPRPCAGRRNQNGAGSPIAATRSTHQVSTAASTAQPQLGGATVAVFIQHTANGFDETSMASISAVSVAGPSQVGAPAQLRRPHARARSAPPEGTRRSPRIRKIEGARTAAEQARAAAAAAAAAETKPHKTHRGTRGGNRKAKAKGLA